MNFLVHGLVDMMMTWHKLQKEAAKAKQTRFLADHPDWYIDISPFDGSFIGLRKDGCEAMFGKADVPVRIMVADITAIDILYNDQSIGGRRQGQTVSNVDVRWHVLRPSKVTSLRLKVTSANAEQSVTFFTYVGKGMSGDTPLVHQSVEKIEYWFGLLSARMAAATPSSQV